MSNKQKLPAQLLAILAGAIAIWLGALYSVKIPGDPIPQTAQTLAVLLAGGLLGPWRGLLAVALYLVAGAAGLAVFSGGTSGLEVLGGYSAGYLFGFLPAATLAGWWRAAKPGRNAIGLLAGMLLAHVLILVPGWTWLAVHMDAEGAWLRGVLPFLPGALVKSALATLILLVVDRLAERTDTGGER